MLLPDSSALDTSLPLSSPLPSLTAMQGISSYSGKEQAIELLPDGSYKLVVSSSCKRSSDGKIMVSERAK